MRCAGPRQAAGSSLLAKLTNLLAADALRLAGLPVSVCLLAIDGACWQLDMHEHTALGSTTRKLVVMRIDALHRAEPPDEAGRWHGKDM